MKILPLLLSAGAILALTGCVTPVANETNIANPAVISFTDASQAGFEVQPILMTIDGVAPRKAGVAAPINGSGPSDRNYGVGTIVASPALRPAGWDFAVAAGNRQLGLLFAVPGNGLLNLFAVTRGQSSEATGLSIDVMSGCQYQIAVKLTVLGGRDYEPVVQWVRPIPTQMGLPAAADCPLPRDVNVALIKS